ncbi:hypothetical protein [Xanthomonas phage SB4]|uniref:Uncharacterized protein n=1 Tax=Xanthomonas phage SB4 TaxID=3117473 RepID=A0ABZ2GUN7_9CAUD
MKKKKSDKPVIKKFMRDGTTIILATGQYANRKRTGKTARKRARKVAA